MTPQEDLLRQIGKEYQILVGYILKLSTLYPNDADLGKVVREIFAGDNNNKN